jgi:dipeptidyl aminopeptidase/acylaminoacyl peptidase
VVLIPSMPLAQDQPQRDIYASLPGGVLPAIDRLAALGIADAGRVGVMGQSFGGYSVYGLLSQTDRFKAGVALAGISDLPSNYLQFDPLARGYPGIEHGRSANPAIVQHAMKLGATLEADADLYRRNSPLTYASRITTPLLLVHGEFDQRGAPAQAEMMFSSLKKQGKTARLLRYWGETHSLAQSPANIRDIVSEAVNWFDRYLSAAPSTLERL